MRLEEGSVNCDRTFFVENGQFNENMFLGVLYMILNLLYSKMLILYNMVKHKNYI